MLSECHAFSLSSQCHNENVTTKYIIVSRRKTSYRKEDANNIKNFQTVQSSWSPPKLAKVACLSSERRQEFPRAKDNQ